jgi:hypothetical protein
MKTKTCLLLIVLMQLSGCIVTPRIELPETISFDAVPPEQKALTYNDIMCCWRCNA